jgi:hypothetical protein
VSDPKTEFVYSFDRRGLFYSLFVLCILYAAWFLIVLWGEDQGFGNDPGRWALMPSFAWALLGLALFLLFIAYALAHLVIRERPGQVYRLEGVPEPEVAAPAAPSFLQPQDQSPAWTEEPTAPPAATADNTRGPGQS